MPRQHPDEERFYALLAAANGGRMPQRDDEFTKALGEVRFTDEALVDRVAHLFAVRESLANPQYGPAGDRSAGVRLAKASRLNDAQADRVGAALDRVSKPACEGSAAVLGSEGRRTYPPLQKGGHVHERIDDVSAALEAVYRELLGDEQ